jgi:hypothetical protein
MAKLPSFKELPWAGAYDPVCEVANREQPAMKCKLRDAHTGTFHAHQHEDRESYYYWGRASDER